jgi:4-amino-4-deoxy-L-arabinose transferase-like glycosyltransferase
MLSRNHTTFFIFIAAALLFIPFLGAVHLFDWDEINFAECAREMIVTGDYSRVYIDFKPFWEKPPLFFWMQSASMHVFGVNEFAARFPNALCGMVTLIVLYRFGARLLGKNFGMLWALAYGGSLFPNMYFKSGIIDPWFNLFIFLSIYQFILYHWKRNGIDRPGLHKKPLTYALWAGIFMGLAILTKGPAALLIFLLASGLYLALNRFRFYFHAGHALLFLFTTLLVTALWFGYETIKNGPWFMQEFFKYQWRLLTTHDAGHEGFFGYHFVVILFGAFPASVFAIPSFFKSVTGSRHEQDFKKWMLILFWVVMILFTLIKTRIIHYSSLAWFPVSFLAAYSFYKWQKGEMKYRKYTGILAAVTGGVLALLLLAFPIIAMNMEKIIPYVKDKFAQANMQADVNWSGWEAVAGIVLVVVIVYGVAMLAKNKFRLAAWVFFGGTAVVVFLASAIIVPKVERYSQGAAVDFFKERQGEDCYVATLDYKSYAHLFYTRKTKPSNDHYYEPGWLLTGRIDKPVYFVTQVGSIEKFLHYTELKELYRKNGFVFLKREVPEAD